MENNRAEYRTERFDLPVIIQAPHKNSNTCWAQVDWEHEATQFLDEQIPHWWDLFIKNITGGESDSRDYPRKFNKKTLWYLDMNYVYTKDYSSSETPDNTVEVGEPTEMTEPDNVVPFPKVAKLTELDKQLNLMAHLNYEVKSWDISFPEDGEPQLYATFTKVEAGHPF